MTTITLERGGKRLCITADMKPGCVIPHLTVAPIMLLTPIPADDFLRTYATPRHHNSPELTLLPLYYYGCIHT